MACPRIALIDYGSGNLRSVAKALERSKLSVNITDDSATIRHSDGVVLPGVGAYGNAVESLSEKGLLNVIRGVLNEKQPYLGLCLGLQLLFQESEEGGLTQGFGKLAGRVERFPNSISGKNLRVPHIGWNRVTFRGNHPMLCGLPKEDYFYFVHSYRAVPVDTDCVVGQVDYGLPFAAAVAGDGFFAVQFHPEKSQWAGKRVLDAFSRWVRDV